MFSINNISIIGTGNVAWHLPIALQNAGLTINQIYGRNELHAKELADSLGVPYTCDTNTLLKSDAYIFAVSDAAISEILSKHTWNNSLLIHVAGSVNIDVFEKYSNNCGVMYPLQSFTRGSEMNINGTPFLVEGSTSENQQTVYDLASRLTQSVSIVDSASRLRIHLAAVFASNYVNYMMGIASQLLEKEQINANILNPLIMETVKKAMEIGAIKAQTGPARRNNINTIKKHEHLLEENPDWQKLYTFVAENIVKFYQQYDGKL